MAYPATMRNPASHRISDSLDAAKRRSLIVEANDGIMTTAGIIEGFAGAGADGHTVTIAAASAMIVGAIVLTGARYSEEAAERESILATIAEEQRLLDLDPQAELDELTAIYESKGLSPDLAAAVATELSAKDALGAQLDAEYGLTTAPSALAPWVIAAAAGLAYASGAVIPLTGVLVLPDDLRAEVTFIGTLLALTVTSAVLARLAHLPLGRTLARTVIVAFIAMSISLAVGRLISI